MSRTLSATARSATVNAAVELLAECSIRDVTVDAVAARSGVAKTTIYRHFSCRDELLAAAIRATLASWPAPRRTGSLDSELRSWAEQVVDSDARRRTPRAAIEFFAEVAASPVLAEAHDEMVEKLFGSLTRILDDARRRGEIVADADIELCADAIAGPLVLRRLRGASVDEEKADRLFSLVLDGVRRSGPPAR